MESGASTGIALIGREGVVGMTLFLGSGSSPSENRVQCAGLGFRLPVEPLRQEFYRGGPFMQVLLRYLQTLIAQMMQTAACNRHGTLEQRLCRWLLLSLDRSSGSELALTQEWIAQMLGVRREGVTEAAGRLQQKGAIRYHRGHVSVLDRPALEQQVHGCYMMDRHHEAARRPPGSGAR
jgi:CRP-like cAMP-binding protein